MTFPLAAGLIRNAKITESLLTMPENSVRDIVRSRYNLGVTNEIGEQLDCGTMNVIIDLTIILNSRLLGFSSWSFRACDHEKTQL